eukprot:15130612-Ditylum_brightwellii.AAC.1
MPGGKMSLLLDKISMGTIYSIGWWHCDKILCYFHMLAHQLIQNHAHTMSLNDKYTFFQICPMMEGIMNIES